MPRNLAGLTALVLLAACAITVTRDDVDLGRPLADFLMRPEGEAAIRAWYLDEANQRSSSYDLAGPVPYVETALAPKSPYERVGFFLAREPWRVVAVLLWQRADAAPPATRGPSPLTLWGLPLQLTQIGTELYAPGARAVLRIVEPGWSPAAAPQVQLPPDVPIKTPTRTFYRDQLFAVEGGRIWFKRNPSAGGTREEPWRLFGDGLPAGADPKAPFERPARIAALSADGDDLLAIDDTGRTYLCTAKSESVSSQDGWSDGWGFPGKRPLHLDGRAAGARSVALGRRAGDAQWFEDAIGNRHNFWPMGTSTLYALHANGQEILFTDNGLPNDFSRELCGPDDGRLVAERLSASASALMLIDRWGRVFTHYDDYDLNGGTPNFEYTYRSEVRADDDGRSAKTSFTPYYLPLAPWRWQPAVALTGAGRLSRQITVLQTGAGNTARELRIAGRGPQGEQGYYRKPIEAEAWEFVPSAEVQLSEAELLAPADVTAGARDQAASGGDLARSALPRAKSYRAQWRGVLQAPPESPDAGAPAELANVPGVEVELDWNPYCPPGRLTFRSGGAVIEVALHTVDFWTPAHRGRPGFDGSPLLLLGTLVLDDALLTDARPAVRAVVARLRPYHHQNFALVLAADQDRLEVRPVEDGVGLRHPIALSLRRQGPYDPPEPAAQGAAAPRTSVVWLQSGELSRLAQAPELLVDPATASRAELERALVANRALREELAALTRAHEQQLLDLEEFRSSLGPARLLAPAIPLGRVSVLPKLMALQWSSGTLVTVEAKASVAAVDTVVADRIASYERALAERAVGPATAR